MNVLKECDCTQIIVSHRFSTILQADYVYLIKDGMIAEEGTIRSLIDKSVYLWNYLENRLKCLILAKRREFNENSNGYCGKSAKSEFKYV